MPVSDLSALQALACGKQNPSKLKSHALNKTHFISDESSADMASYQHLRKHTTVLLIVGMYRISEYCRHCTSTCVVMSLTVGLVSLFY